MHVPGVIDDLECHEFLMCVCCYLVTLVASGHRTIAKFFGERSGISRTGSLNLHRYTMISVVSSVIAFSISLDIVNRPLSSATSSGYFSHPVSHVSSCCE
jgi:hypothetical protein